MINKADKEDMGKKKNRQQRRPHRRQRRRKSKVKATERVSQSQQLTQLEIYARLHSWHQQQMLRLCGVRETEAKEHEAPTTNCQDYVWESSSEDEDEEETKEPVDENYLKFLEITIRHQEELKQKRERDRTAATADPTADLTTTTVI
ncbi:uncharacterized protein [Drosophila tropicalis]|uniref:uncharacterized protein n=1 Tax=Drosophila tropicalis TaxID=46794 RepID=UPI0035ABB519